MDLGKLSRDDWLFAGLALLLVIDLLFVPWFDYNFGFGPFTRSVTLTATDTPDGWLGVLAVLSTLAVIADLALERFGSAELPSIGGSRPGTRLTLVGVAALFLALKFIIHAHFSLFGFGFWAAVVLTIALVAVAMRALETEAVGASVAPEPAAPTAEESDH
jgi:hypothetical protein